MRRDIDDNGDLLVRRMGKAEAERRALVAALAAPSWLDPDDRRAAHVKLLRTIRLDPSDTFVFERAAEPGEWAVSGAFMFADADPDALEGKARAAFRSGFLGVAVARLVDPGADRRGERRRPRRARSRCWRSSWSQRSARPSIADARAPRRRRRSRSPPRSAITRATR